MHRGVLLVLQSTRESADSGRGRVNIVSEERRIVRLVGFWSREHAYIRWDSRSHSPTNRKLAN